MLVDNQICKANFDILIVCPPNLLESVLLLFLSLEIRNGVIVFVKGSFGRAISTVGYFLIIKCLFLLTSRRG